MPNTILREVNEKQIFPDVKNFVSTATSFTQGDHLILDVVSGLVRSPTAESEAVNYLGIAYIDIANGKPLSPYTTSVDASQAIPSINGPQYGNVVQFTLQTGATVTAGAPVYVYPAGGNQYVAATGTAPIGVYEGPAITSAASGTTVAVLLGSRYPNNTLKF